jgi:hypothetical protein
MFNFKKSYTKKTSFFSRSFNKANCEKIKMSLSRILAEFKYDHDNVSSHWEILKGLITSVIDKHSPLKSITPKSLLNVPWFDKTLVSLARIRDKAYNKAIKANKNSNSNLLTSKSEFEEFKNARNKFHSVFKKKKFDYFKNIIDTQSTSSKKLWNNIQSFVDPNKKNIIIPSFILKGESNNTTLDASNCFVNFFSSVINKFSFLHLSVCLNFISIFFKNHFKIVLPNVSFEFPLISTQEVLDQLNSLDVHSAKGAVGIDTRIIKYCSNELATPFANLFNKCIKSNTIPDEWKIAHLTPIYKGKGSKSDINNYRPLSVLPPIAKIFESLSTIRITNYF